MAASGEDLRWFAAAPATLCASATIPWNLAQYTMFWISASTLPSSTTWLLGEDNYYEFSSDHPRIVNFA
ncbi:MAG: hypothetical protein ACK56W_21165 [Pirellula sp.]|nr:hypothetical protein [Pirellula sp.]